MKPSRNRVSLLGVLTQAPVSKPVGQTTLTTISIETQRSYNYKGQDKEEIAIVEVDFFGKTAEAISQYCRAGSLVDVDARLKLDSWESNGKTYTKLKCVGDSIQFLDRQSASSERPSSPRPPTAGVPTGRSTPARPTPPPPSDDTPPDAEDDVPF